jgi:pimeloyl-ACP methyl ester carboxylesterase
VRVSLIEDGPTTSKGIELVLTGEAFDVRTTGFAMRGTGPPEHDSGAQDVPRPSSPLRSDHGPGSGVGPVRGRIAMFAICCVMSALLLSSSKPAPAAPFDRAALRWWAGYFESSRKVTLGDGRHLNLYCMGSGSPLVVMEAGLGYGAWTWRRVQEAIAGGNRVCAYDRAGYFQQSSQAAGTRDAGAEADDLDALLKAAHLSPPFLLVAHSYGGYIARLFAYRHSGEIAGLVLVDPSSEDQYRRIASVAPEVAGSVAANDERVRACAVAPRPSNLAETCVLFAPRPDLPPDRVAWFGQAQDAIYAGSMLREREAMDKISSDELRAERKRLRVPVVLLNPDPLAPHPGLSERSGAALSALWLRMHLETVSALSNDGELRIVAGAGHNIQNEKPEAVVKAVKDVVLKISRRAPDRDSSSLRSAVTRSPSGAARPL